MFANTTRLTVLVGLCSALSCLGFTAAAHAQGFEIEVDGEVPDDGSASTEEPAGEADGEVAPDESGESGEASVSAGEDAQARALFEAGSTSYERGEYPEAYTLFVRAYEISHRPALMYNASQAAERAGDLPHAVEWAQRFVDNPDADRDERDRQRPRLENLRARLAASGHSEPDADDGFFMPIPAFISYLVGGAGLLTFATFGILTLHEDSSLSDTCSARPCTSADLGDLHTFSRAADAGWIIGVAGVAAGTILWLLSPGDDERPAVAFEPWLGPELVGGGARLRF